MSTASTTLAPENDPDSGVDSTDVTAGGSWNNTTNPLTVAAYAATYTHCPITPGAYIKIGTEFLRLVSYDPETDEAVFARGEAGSTNAFHADAVAIYATISVRFRLWGKWLSDQLTAAGWTKTADTGQIDWSTTPCPDATAERTGYEIRTFGDTLQSTYPVTMKVTYGSPAAARARPCVYLQFGTGSDGAGTLTGATSAEITSTNGTNNSTAYNSYVSYDGSGKGRFQYALFTGLASAGIWGTIERTKDANGADTGEGILVVMGGAAACNQLYWTYGGVSGTVETTAGVIAPTFGGGSDGVNTSIYPVLLSRGTWANPPLGMLFGFTASFSTPTVTVPIYGTDHVYLVLGSPTINATSGLIRNTTANGITILLRYE